MTNKFILEPTNENLERYRIQKNNKIYWHTADFFKYDPKLEDELSDIFDAYIDAITDNKEEGKDEDKVNRKIGFSIAKLIVNTAKRLNIPSRDLREQFDNYATVIWSPICVWKKDDFGNVSYSLRGGI